MIFNCLTKIAKIFFNNTSNFYYSHLLSKMLYNKKSRLQNAIGATITLKHKDNNIIKSNNTIKQYHFLILFFNFAN